MHQGGGSVSSVQWYIQVSTGPGLLAAGAGSLLLLCTLNGREKKKKEKKKEETKE